MTLTEFINKYNGVVVADGQCGSLVRAYWNEVDLTVPPSYPDSKDYWPNPVPGYDKITSNPQPGNIAIYSGHGAFSEGHSAIYVGNGQVFEQNADPDGSPAHVYARQNTYLLGYLSKQGANVEPIFNEGDRKNINFWLYGEDRLLWSGVVEEKIAYKTAIGQIFTSQEYATNKPVTPLNRDTVLDYTNKHLQ